MSDTTTIEIRDEQRDELKALKQHDRESYKSVIDRLLDGDTSDEPEGVDTEALGREVARQIDYAHLSDRVSEQVAKQLQR